MTDRKQIPTKNRRKIGEVTFLMEEMTADGRQALLASTSRQRWSRITRCLFRKRSLPTFVSGKKIRSDTDIRLDD